MNQLERPIGIFDSGIGGLSVLRHIRKELPNENLRYFADSGFAPYGEKPEAIIIQRSLKIAQYLFTCNCKALVIACNTATAAAIHLLREKYPEIPIVGIEPGLKPAAAMTQTQTVGVLATERTLHSNKFRNLHQQLSNQTGVRFMMQACPGLADLVEKNELHSTRAIALVQSYIRPLIEQNADTLVLGCTHYPFLQKAIENTISEYAAKPVHIIDTGIAVTRQLVRLLNQYNLKQANPAAKSSVHAQTTGHAAMLSDQFEQLLGIRPDVTSITTDMITTLPSPFSSV